ncbi:MAG: NfeD family protein [Thermoguttaceae bacterium]|jgi:membrane-bound serine protease (ClpP class)
MDIWICPILLLSLGLGLAFLEIFFPTAGILAFFSGSALLGAILLGFRSGTTVGLTITSAAVIGVPCLIGLGFRWWPHTYFGKQVLLDAPRAEDVLPDEAQRRQLKSLVGRIGRAKCRMLPSGVVSVDGQTLDATSEGMVIESGQTVRVIKIEANRLVVRAIEGEIPTPTAENPLERPIDSIATDPFGEQLV